jgi:hypothetical protein
VTKETAVAPSKASATDVLAFLDAAIALQDEQKYQKAKFFRPYPKQALFLAAGFSFRERLLMAGNQLGKTETGAFETYCHLTGRYPDWWLGHRWFAGTSSRRSCAGSRVWKTPSALATFPRMTSWSARR